MSFQISIRGRVDVGELNSGVQKYFKKRFQEPHKESMSEKRFHNC